MKGTNGRTILIVALLALALVVTAGGLLAQGGFEISWWTVDGGGGVSTGDNYSVAGTIGQPDAGRMTGGDFEIVGGFWGSSSAGPPENLVLLPFVSR